jgi:hypothetical protein
LISGKSRQRPLRAAVILGTIPVINNGIDIRLGVSLSNSEEGRCVMLDTPLSKLDT